MSIEQAIDRFLQRHTEDVLVAVSGGRDSMALLHALVSRNTYLDRRVIICHVNHMLRGEESDADQEFVEQSALHLVDGVLSANIDVGMMDGSMESNARDVRYAFFAECAKHENIKDIVLAHHADDQAETVLYNLLRGSSQLKGMKEFSEREVDGVMLKLHRPLLEVSRAEVDTYIIRHGIEYREDSSNAQPVAVRNRLRNEALPLLDDIMQRDVSGRINECMKMAEEDDRWIASGIDASDYIDPQGRLFLPKLKVMHVSVLRRVFKNYLTDNCVVGVSSKLIEQAMNLIDSEQSAKVNLPGGGQICRKEKRIFIKQ